MHDRDNAQLGFDAMLGAAEDDNRRYRFDKDTRHLPGTMDEALPFFRILLRHHHAAMLAGDADETFRLRKEADRLALRLNDGDPGILAGPDAPGNVLERQTAAKAGTVPRWGQSGTFDLCIEDMNVRIELEGVFGIASSTSFWPGFSARAVEYDRPFLSETGYRSFLGLRGNPEPGYKPDEFVARVLRTHIDETLKGRLVPVEERYRR